MLVNKSNIPTSKLEKIIKFVKPRGLKLCDITIKDSYSKYYPWRAEFYFQDYHNPHIICRFNSYEFFPFHSHSRKSFKGYNYDNYNFETKTACLVYILAHEIYHLFTLRHPDLTYLMYSTLPDKEELADAYAIKKLNQYKQLKEEGNDPLNSI